MWGFVEPDYTLQWFHERWLTDQRFNRLFGEWVRSGFNKLNKPSIDRIDHRKPYSKNNIQVMSWGDNWFKQRMERRNLKGAVVQLKDGEVVATYKSQREAAKLTGFWQGNISMALNGRIKTSMGYQWRWSNPNLLKGNQ